MVDQNSTSQIIIWMATLFSVTSLTAYLAHRYTARKHWSRRQVSLVVKIAMAVPISIILGLGFGWSPLIILLMMIGGTAFGIVHTYAFWGTREKLYGKDK